MYPTINANITNSLVRTGYDDLNKPKTGLATSFVSQDKWDGFNVTSSTELVILEAESEGLKGDGKTTCTLCQKGDNYSEIETEKASRLVNLIKKNNPIITSSPTLTTSAAAVEEYGLYVSTSTNSGNPTYYFRGKVSNNLVIFAGLTWRIVRINEDGNVKLMYSSGVGAFNESFIKYHTSSSNYEDLYYSNNIYLKPKVESWYQTTIIDKGLDSYVAVTEFCEQAKVRLTDDYNIGNAHPPIYTDYIPNFRCSTDENGHGIYRDKVGLITYDELIYSGAYHGMNTYWQTPISYAHGHWTMSPAGVLGNYGYVWKAAQYGYIGIEKTGDVQTSHILSPVISLNANVKATGTGTSSDPYVIQTN